MTKVEKVEDPYETVNIAPKLVVECPAPTIPNGESENTARDNVEKAFHATFFGIVHGGEPTQDNPESMEDGEEQCLYEEASFGGTKKNN